MPPESRPPAETLEPTTGYLLVRIAEAIDSRFVSLLAPLGVRPRHLHVLRYLYVYGAVSQQALAGGIRVDPGNLVQTLDDLEAAGLIRREIDPGDRRRRLLNLTADGRRTLRRGIAASERADDEVLGLLTEAERSALHIVALRIYAHLRRSSRSTLHE